MRLTRIAKTFPILAATLANARLAKLGLPEEIKPGEKFNITVEQAIGIPMVEVSMQFGIDRYDPTEGVAPQPGNMGATLLESIDLRGIQNIYTAYLMNKTN